ncbi:hypothetical protein [Pseudogemmobacter sonorensis]
MLRETGALCHDLGRIGITREDPHSQRRFYRLEAAGRGLVAKAGG